MKPTHTEFQEQVVQVAHLYGCRHLHVRRTVGRGRKWTTATNVIGWPDLTIWRAPDLLLFVELKVPPDFLTREQSEVLADLGRLAFARAECWTWSPDIFETTIVPALARTTG